MQGDLGKIFIKGRVHNEFSQKLNTKTLPPKYWSFYLKVLILAGGFGTAKWYSSYEAADVHDLTRKQIDNFCYNAIKKRLSWTK